MRAAKERKKKAAHKVMNTWPEQGDLWQIWIGTQCHTHSTLPNKQSLNSGDRAEAFLFSKMGLKEEGRLRGTKQSYSRKNKVKCINVGWSFYVVITMGQSENTIVKCIFCVYVSGGTDNSIYVLQFIFRKYSLGWIIKK